MSHENEKYQNEELTAEDAEFRHLLGSLKKVEAPADFDFRLKARIATAKTAPARPRFGWATRLAFPAVAVFAISSFFLYSLMRTDVGDLARNEVPAIEKSSVAPANMSVVSPPQNIAPASNSVAAPPSSNPSNTVAKTTPASESTAPKPTPPAERRDADLGGGGSIDSSVKPADEVKLPVMSAPSAANATPKVNQNTTTLTVRDVLSINGINVELDGQKWIVRSVTPNSVGDASGVRQNDVIEAINDQPVNFETVFTKSLSGKSLTLTRAGVRTRILLRTRQ